MSVYLKRYGLAVTKYNANDTGISGSSRFANVLSWFETELQPKIREKMFRGRDAVAVAKIEGDPDSVEVRAERGVKRYGVNKKKLMDRLSAYVCLSRSKRFLAFYSVSFPAGTPDEVIGKIWNSCLTSLREKMTLKSYIWVMERQGNGTMHYHMLTNDDCRAPTVNAVVADCIDYYVQRGVMSWGNSSASLYNGVDVENISKRVKAHDRAYSSNAYRMVTLYVTKYMSKNKAEETRRQWHCSRLVSALFVTAYLNPEEASLLFECDASHLINRKIVSTENGDVILFAAVDCSVWRETVGLWNDRVYAYFEAHSLW